MSRFVMVPVPGDAGGIAYSLRGDHINMRRAEEVYLAEADEQLARDLEQVCRHAENAAAVMSSAERNSIPAAVGRIRAAAGLDSE